MLHKFRVPNFGTQEGRKDMTQKVKRIVALILSMLMILSSVTVYAADDNADTQQTGHTLTVNVAGEGYVEVNGEGITESADNSYSVPPATTVTVTATPGEGMQLSGITLDGVIQSESFLMPDHDAVLDITFEAVPQPANVEEDNETVEAKPEPETTEEPADTGETARVERNVNTVVPAAEKIEPGIDLSSYVMLATTRSSGIPSVGNQVTGSCYIGDTWNVNYPYQDYFYVSDFSGDLAGAVTVQDFECLDPTAALPSHTWASYVATVTEVNVSGGYVEYSVYVTPPGATDGVTTDGSGHLSGYQHVGGKVRVTREFVGSIELYKSSANPDLTDNNSCYDRSGAVYGVYSGNDKIAELTTDSNGYAKVENIPAGSYTVKEITAPKGYALDLTAHNVTVVSGQTATLQVTDLPQSDPIAVLLGKIDRETTQNMPQGSASLEGAQFTVKYYDGFYDTDPAEQGVDPVRTWVMRTNTNGFVRFDESAKVSGDEFYYMSNGDITLPLGTITIQETAAPKGYLLNDEVFIRQITTEGNAEAVETYNAPSVPEDVIRGDIQIVKYGENNAETDDSSADIKRPLEGVKFHLTSKTTQEVYTIITDEQGIASTTQLRDEDNERGGLPFDTYIVTEESPYPEYDEVAPFEVTIDTEGKTLYYILRNDTVDAPIKVEKIDKTTGKVIPAAGAQFQILDSEKNVISMTVSHYPSLVEIDTFETDASGSFTLPEKLEYGTYYLREVQAPEGYLLGGEDIKFVVDQEYQWDNPLTVQYADAPAMGRIEIVKTDAETGDALEGAEFSITAAEDIVTPDGTVRAVAGDVVDTAETDEDGIAVTDSLYLGKYEVRETKTLPGYYLPTDKVWEVELVYQDQNTEIVTETLEVENIHPEIGTTAKDQDTGTNQGIAKEQTTIIDTVEYTNVNPGTEYTIKGVLMNKETGEPLLVNGEQITAEKTFAPETSEGSVELAFTFDSSALKGNAVVVFETLYEGEIEAAVHADITDEGQTVEFPEHKIHTTATDEDTGNHQGIAKEQTTIVDTVEYTGLIPGQEYTLKGELMRKDTGEVFEVNGEPVTAEKTFTAETSEGSIDLEFTFDSSALKGEAVVVFEHLYAQETEVASHTDLTDEGQTVEFPEHEIHTTAKDKETGTHQGTAKKDVTIVDTVKYTGLIPGQEYTVKGILMLKETGEPLLVNGEQVTAEKTFTPETSEGSVDVEFTFDASELNNKNVVVFESLYAQETEVATHTDINDEGQTVSYKVGTLTVDMPGNGGNGISVKTGDSGAPIYYIIGVMLIAVGVTGITLGYKRKAGKKNEEK